MSRISRRAALTLAAVSVPVVNTVPAAAAEPESMTSVRATVLRADLITAVTPRDNWRVIAVAIRCTGRIHLHGGPVAPSAFEVAVTIGGATTSRTVTRVYPNTAPEVAEQGRP